MFKTFKTIALFLAFACASFAAQQTPFSFWSAAAAPSTAILIWPMNQASGTTITDTSGNGYTGNTNCGWFGSAPLPDGNTYYATFNGSSQFTYSAYNIVYGSSQIITVDFYGYATDWTQGSSQAFIAYSYPGGANSWQIANTTSGGLYLVFSDASNNTVSYTTTTMTNSVWTHIKVVFNGTTGTIQAYFNGGSNQAVFGSGSVAPPITYNSAQVIVGSLGGVIDFFHGNLALFKIFPGDTH